MVSVNQTGQSKKSRRQGTVIQRYKGSYQIRYSALDSNGNRKQVNESIKGSKRDAEKLLRKRLDELDNGIFVNKSTGTVDQLFAEFLNIHCVPPKVRLRSKHHYESYIRRYITPNIGHIRFQKLTLIQIKKIYSEMQERGLSSTTVRNLHRLIRKGFNWACSPEIGLLAKNPTDGITAPSREEHEITMWEIETIHEFLDLCDQSTYGDVFSFAIRTGLRRSEICGLKWDAVDLVEGRLRVTSTLHYINGHGLVTAEPKTKKSRRTIVLAPDTIDLLHAVKGSQQLKKYEYGASWHNTGYVFTRPTGLPVVPQEVTKEFTRFVREHNLPHLTFHGLRHAFATLGLIAGIPAKIVSEALGHSTIGITLDLYSHVLPSMEEEHMLTIDNLLKREV